MVSFGFFQNHDGLKDHIDDVCQKFLRTHRKLSAWANLFPLFRSVNFPFMFQPPVLPPSAAKAKFQIEFGYDIILQELLAIYGPAKPKSKTTPRDNTNVVQDQSKGGLKKRKEKTSDGKSAKKQKTSGGNSASLPTKPKGTPQRKKQKPSVGNSASLPTGTRLQKLQTELLLQVWTSPKIWFGSGKLLVL